MTEAAKTLGVTNHAIRRLIETKILAADQVVPGTPFQIRASNLETDAVTAAIARKGRPCRIADPNTLPMFQAFDKERHKDSCIAKGLMAFSMVLESISTRPSVRKIKRPSH